MIAVNRISSQKLAIGAVFVASLAAQPPVHADDLTCHFSEPYITIRHDTVAASLQISGLGIPTREVAPVGLTLSGVNSFELSWGEGRRLALTIDYQGHDTMSDIVYPISARYYGSADAQRFLTGGCESSRLPRIVPIDQPDPLAG